MARGAVGRVATAIGLVLLLTLPACGGEGGSANGESGPTATVSGEITTEDGAAIPEGAVVVVRVFADVQQPTSASVVGTQEIVTSGEQPPIAFEVAYPEDAIDAQKEYRVGADITVDGILTHLPTEGARVITQGAPSSGIELLLVPVS